jgi:hypothetical protein
MTALVNFSDFVRAHEEALLRNIAAATAGMPALMSKADYRFQISNLFCHALVKPYSGGGEHGALESAYSEGFDLSYARLCRVSVKVQKQIFGTARRRPSNIILKNSLGRVVSEKDNRQYCPNFDYLMAIERGVPQSSITVSVGVLAAADISKYLIGTSSDQIKCRVPSEGWTVRLGPRTFQTRWTPTEAERATAAFQTRLSEMYDELLEHGKGLLF